MRTCRQAFVGMPLRKHYFLAVTFIWAKAHKIVGASFVRAHGPGYLLNQKATSQLHHAALMSPVRVATYERYSAEEGDKVQQSGLQESDPP